MDLKKIIDFDHFGMNVTIRSKFKPNIFTYGKDYSY